MTELVYKSGHRTVLEAVGEWRKARQAFSDDLHAFVTRHIGEGRSGLVVNGVKEIRFVGVERLRGEKEPPSELWRADDRNGWVPRRTTKAGKQLAAEMAAITAPDLFGTLPGMPREYWDVLQPDCSHKVFTPGFRVSDAEVVWVTWGTARMLDDPKWNVDDQLWERAKLSEYYAAIEADDESAERPTVTAS